MESLLRLAFYWAQQVHKKNAHQQEKPSFAVSKYLEAFIDTYLAPIFHSSQIPRLRSEIHKSKNLNKLLFLNAINMKRLFNEYLIGKIFMMDFDTIILNFKLIRSNLIDFYIVFNLVILCGLVG